MPVSTSFFCNFLHLTVGSPYNCYGSGYVLHNETPLYMLNWTLNCVELDCFYLESYSHFTYIFFLWRNEDIFK